MTDHMMLYDYRRGETVVVGGVGPWGLQHVANQRIFPVSETTVDYISHPVCGNPVVEGAIVYDGFHDIYFAFGGNHYYRGYYLPEYAEPAYEDIWWRGVEDFPCGYKESDITVELLYGPTIARPGQRAQCAMVYDENRRVTVLFGGVGGTRYGDTWELLTRDRRETWVHFNYPGRELGTFEFPYNTLAEGSAGVTVGGTLKIKTGSTPETLQLTKAMTIEAIGGPVIIGRP